MLKLYLTSIWIVFMKFARFSLYLKHICYKNYILNKVFKSYFQKLREYWRVADFKYCLKIDIRSHGLDKQNAIDRYSQPKEIRTRRLGRAHSTKACTILGVEPSRQKCLRVLINLIELIISSSIQKKSDENSQFCKHPNSNHAPIN